MKALFLGTPEFSVDTLKVLHEDPDIELVKVITMPDRPKGRGQKLQSPPVAIYAQENNLPLLQTSNINQEDSFFEEMEKHEIDFALVLAFAQFLKTPFLELPKLGCFNIHTSLLPKYRGAAPIQYALLNGDKNTGVSIQRMVLKMDAGDLAYSHEVEISPIETNESLFSKLQKEAALGLKNFLPDLKSNQIKLTPQDESNVSFAPTIKKTDGLLKFDELSFQEFTNRWRGHTPWPGVYFFLNHQRVKLHNFKKTDSKISPGKVEIIGSELHIGLKDASIRAFEIQLEGKKRSEDKQVINGLKNKFTEFYLTQRDQE